MKKIFTFLLAMLFGASTYSQVITSWQTVPTNGPHLATVNNINLETAVLNRGPGLAYSGSSTFSYISIFKIDVDKGAAKARGSYYEVTIKAKDGYFVSLASLDAKLRRAKAESVNKYRWSYSLNGTDFTEVGPADVTMTDNATINTNGEVQPKIDLSDVFDLQYVPSTTTIKLRMYAWGATLDDNLSNFGFGKSSATVNTLAFSGTVVNALPTFKVQFTSNGGSPVAELQPIYNSLISAPIAPTRTGYTFGGWYKEAALTNAWNFSTDVVTKATTLYAKWTAIKYTVSFQSNGGSNVAPFQADYDTKITAPTPPVRNNFLFADWYKDVALNSPWDFANDLIQGNTTLYAKWNDRSQTISFDQIADKVYGNPAFVLNATATSALAVIYEALTPNISITGNTVTITGTGLATIKATQAGNGFYLPATPVEISFDIAKAPQVITFAKVGPLSRYIGEVELKATSNSGLPVVLTADRPDVAVLNGKKLQVKALGDITVTATQDGDDNYLPAEPVARVITIHTASSLQILVNQAFSPNGDGVNDLFIIDGIKTYPENQVTIMNKNGVEVFKKKGYDNELVVFEGRNTNGDKLTAGTYYYSVEMKIAGQWVQKKGYLVLRY